PVRHLAGENIPPQRPDARAKNNNKTEEKQAKRSPGLRMCQTACQLVRQLYRAAYLDRAARMSDGVIILLRIAVRIPDLDRGAIKGFGDLEGIINDRSSWYMQHDGKDITLRQHWGIHYAIAHDRSVRPLLFWHGIPAVDAPYQEYLARAVQAVADRLPGERWIGPTMHGL